MSDKTLEERITELEDNQIRLFNIIRALAKRIEVLEADFLDYREKHQDFVKEIREKFKTSAKKIDQLRSFQKITAG